MELKALPSENLYIMVKRNLHDLKISDVRPYLKKLILLANKQHVPMLYIDRDFKTPQPNVTYTIFHLKKDYHCPYVSLRIIA
jgi:hypothetical protein